MSRIEWTDATWNPVTGCTPIATGCKHCYAKEMHRRLRAMGQAKYQHDFFEVQCHPEELEKPLHWRKPRMVFVNSMSDLFHEDVSGNFILDVFLLMGRCPQHTFQVLTKRPQRMMDVLGGLSGAGLSAPPLPNVWLGASASTQADLERVVPPLMETPAAVRFLSLEPLLGPVVLRMQALRADWVIVGAESGPHRRECKHEWIESLVTQCVEADVPVFVKQAHIDGLVVKMPEILGRVWDQMPTSKGETHEDHIVRGVEW